MCNRVYILTGQEPSERLEFRSFISSPNSYGSLCKKPDHLHISLIASLAYSPYSLTIPFRMIAHTDLSYTNFLHLLRPTDLGSPSIQSNHLNFRLPAFFFNLVSQHILSLRSYHQTFFADARPILIFLHLLKFHLQYPNFRIGKFMAY
jgi:hypothetical protein